MKLPDKKQRELKDEGKPDSPKLRGGGAMGRLRQFEKERGLEETDLSNPAADESRKDEDKPKRSPKK